MAKTRTLANLITDIKDEGGFYRSKVFTDALLTRWINLAIGEVWETLSLEEHGLKSSEITTTSGQDYVNLPSDFWRLIKLDLKHSATEYTRLSRIDPSDDNVFYEDIGVYNQYGDTYVYYIASDTVELRPVPSRTDTLRVTYIPSYTTLVNANDTFDGVNGWEDLVVQLVLAKCARREQRTDKTYQAEISRLYKRLERAVTRDVEPYPLPDHGAY